MDAITSIDRYNPALPLVIIITPSPEDVDAPKTQLVPGLLNPEWKKYFFYPYLYLFINHFP
jgi:hypothetical protein